MKVLMIFCNTNNISIDFENKEMLYLNEISSFNTNEELEKYFCQYAETMSEDLSTAIYNYESSVEEVNNLLDEYEYNLACDLEGIESSINISQIITMHTDHGDDNFDDMYIGIVYEI